MMKKNVLIVEDNRNMLSVLLSQVAGKMTLLLPVGDDEPAPQQYDMLGTILDKLDKAAQQMQELAIKQSQQPPKETADDILAAIIRPPKKKE